MKSFFISFGALLLLAAAGAVFVLIFVFDMSPNEVMNTANSQGKLLLYKYNLVDHLTSSEIKQLYLTNCTRKCHSSELVENRPRTAAEWDTIVKRMKAPDRANLTDREANLITRYLQTNFLSNIPTVLPEKTMKFVRRYLWKSDFGESDLYLDIIFIPNTRLSLLPYMVASNEPPKKQGAVFVIYLNTHQGMIPPWNLRDMAMLKFHDSNWQKATDWTALYRDSQSHHIQGILIFPDIDEKTSATMEVTIRLPGMRERVFQWILPIPSMTE